MEEKESGYMAKVSLFTKMWKSMRNTEFVGHLRKHEKRIYQENLKEGAIFY